MATTIKTVNEILSTLNQGNTNGPWIALAGFSTMDAASIKGTGINVDHGSGLILKVFLNTTTAETRTYLAKFLDEGKQIP